jgi:hypothetical protein
LKMIEDDPVGTLVRCAWLDILLFAALSGKIDSCLRHLRPMVGLSWVEWKSHPDVTPIKGVAQTDCRFCNFSVEVGYR